MIVAHTKLPPSRPTQRSTFEQKNTHFFWFTPSRVCFVCRESESSKTRVYVFLKSAGLPGDDQPMVGGSCLWFAVWMEGYWFGGRPNKFDKNINREDFNPYVNQCANCCKHQRSSKLTKDITKKGCKGRWPYWSLRKHSTGIDVPKRRSPFNSGPFHCCKS